MLSVMFWLRDLQKVVVGDPAQEGVKMGALVNAEQRADVQEKVNICWLQDARFASVVRRICLLPVPSFPPTLLYCPQPDETPAVHATEAFGPVATLMPAQTSDMLCNWLVQAAVALRERW
ncbi:aldehyde dehydrogenase family protein [Escherichia coli]